MTELDNRFLIFKPEISFDTSFPLPIWQFTV